MSKPTSFEQALNESVHIGKVKNYLQTKAEKESKRVPYSEQEASYWDKVYTSTEDSTGTYKKNINFKKSLQLYKSENQGDETLLFVFLLMVLHTQLHERKAQISNEGYTISFEASKIAEYSGVSAALLCTYLKCLEVANVVAVLSDTTVFIPSRFISFY